MTVATPGREEELKWSCDERNRKKCRNGHGCHCREITDLLHRLSAKPADESDIFGIAVHALTVGAPGIGPTIRDGIARSISMRVKAVLSTTGEPKR